MPKSFEKSHEHMRHIYTRCMIKNKTKILVKINIVYYNNQKYNKYIIQVKTT